MTPSWSVRGNSISRERPLVMGIVNVTPDSFSDGGSFFSPAAALAHSAKLMAYEPRQRVFGGIGAAVAAFERGASIFRVHDVAATRQALDVAVAIRDAGGQ